jgi:hypothetical protein
MLKYPAQWSPASRRAAFLMLALIVAVGRLAQGPAAGTSTLARVSEWAAIVTVVLVAGTTLWTVGRWLWRRLRAADIKYGLFVTKDGWTARIVPQGPRFGFDLTNGKDEPLSWLPTVFRVEAAGESETLATGSRVRTVAPGETSNWLAPPAVVTFPANLILTYEAHYGHHGHGMRRRMGGSIAVNVWREGQSLMATWDEEAESYDYSLPPLPWLRFWKRPSKAVEPAA